MLIKTTITAMKDGICLFETDVVCSIDWKVDRYNELEWWVDEYRIEEKRHEYDTTAEKYREKTVSTDVPKKLAEIYDEYLDRTWMEEKVRERLVDHSAERADALYDAHRERF
jgi:hypothetical protein